MMTAGARAGLWFVVSALLASSAASEQSERASHSIRELLASEGDLARRVSAELIDPAMLELLLSDDRPVRVTLLYGLWCQVCDRVLPKGLAMLVELEREHGWQVELIEIPRPADGQRDPEAMRLKVREIPAAILFREGQEVGRLVGADGWRRPQRAFARALGLAPQRHRPMTLTRGSESGSKKDLSREQR